MSTRSMRWTPLWEMLIRGAGASGMSGPCLVLYGDHLPALNLEAEDMESSSLYRTEYIIWDNFGLEQQDEPLAAYQLSAAVLGRLGHHHRADEPAFQQTCREEPTYRADLRMLQYDALYGKGSFAIEGVILQHPQVRPVCRLLPAGLLEGGHQPGGDAPGCPAQWRTADRPPGARPAVPARSCPR